MGLCYHPPRIHPFPRCLFLDADSNSKEAGTYPPGTRIWAAMSRPGAVEMARGSAEDTARQPDMENEKVAREYGEKVRHNPTNAIAKTFAIHPRHMIPIFKPK